jgi:hypothetical protein
MSDQFIKVLRVKGYSGNHWYNVEDNVFENVDQLIALSKKRFKDRERDQRDDYWYKLDTDDWGRFKSDHTEYQKLLSEYAGEFLQLPNYLKKHKLKFTTCTKTGLHPAWELKIGYKCIDCNGVAVKEFNSIHLYSDDHVVEAYRRKFDCEEVDGSHGIGKVALKNMGLCEEVRGKWLVRKGLNTALQAQKEVITAVNQRQMLELLRDEFMMPSPYR